MKLFLGSIMVGMAAVLFVLASPEPTKKPSQVTGVESRLTPQLRLSTELTAENRSGPARPKNIQVAWLNTPQVFCPPPAAIPLLQLPQYTHCRHW